MWIGNNCLQLRKGRFCILEYARVHRNCVFSHEELMVKMAKCATKLSVNVGVAVHEELYEIIVREKHLREIITSKGITEYVYYVFQMRTIFHGIPFVCIT